MSKMPEKENEEEKTSEKPESEETKEKESEEEEKKPSEEEEEEEKEEEPEEEPEEPKKRFPKEKQTAEDKKLGFEFRQWKKKKLEGTLEEEDFEDEEEKPVTRKELSELLEKKDKESVSERMLQEFLGENPDFRKYEKKIRKYVNDPDYSNVPIGFIASGIIGENLDDEANERAELKHKADEEAAKTKSSGSTRRGVPGKKKSIWDMSKEEFEEYQTDVLQKNRE